MVSVELVVVRLMVLSRHLSLPGGPEEIKKKKLICDGRLLGRGMNLNNYWTAVSKWKMYYSSTNTTYQAKR